MAQSDTNLDQSKPMGTSSRVDTVLQNGSHPYQSSAIATSANAMLIIIIIIIIINVTMTISALSLPLSPGDTKAENNITQRLD
eukprot:6038623-Amphidinium_carterae.2